jgi:hypothetical protein
MATGSPGREQFVRFMGFVARSAIASSPPCREIFNSTNATNLTNHIHRAGGTVFECFSNVPGVPNGYRDDAITS